MKKILIELPTWLGDAVMTSPAIENLIKYFISAQITIVGSFVAVEAFKNHPLVFRTHVLQKNYRALYKTANFLGSFDYFFSFRGSFRSKVFSLFLSSKNKFQYNQKNDLLGHQVERYNNFINNCIKKDYLPGALVLYPDETLSSNSLNPLVGISPGSSYGSAKRWYPKEFAKVAASLSKTHHIVILGSIAEQEIASDIEKKLIEIGVSNFTNLVGKTSVTELIKQISTLDLFITGDSGPMHVAASFQVPTVSIFGPTKSIETAQWLSKKSIIIKKNLDCQPCMKRVCPLGHHDCMKLIKANEVISACSDLIFSSKGKFN